ncbi:GAF and ANTAR domain-containing protein [Nocardioides terrisoli]|uniref:GAF and ANTAR domain-containing protein n=1 Tax=Nocardioides terrisoli TaxID=3388267 RepID=UPI00287BB75A|nr:GAF and ANTAR domain-containing protein [Nocardioides marmorisolisilvae]
MERDSLLSTLSELAVLTLDESDIENTAEAVVSIAMHTIGCEYAGLTVFEPNGFASLAPSDPIVEKVDKLQHHLQQGPCVEAAWEGDTFISGDLTAEPRWPEWSKQAAAEGLRSMLATRLVSGDHVLGALNLYSSAPRDFTADDRDFARVFAVHATTALLAVRERESLRVAVDARTLIGQAQGILMERFDIDADRAFSVLRRYSQTRNVKLRVIAEDVVASRTLPPEER